MKDKIKPISLKVDNPLSDLEVIEALSNELAAAVPSGVDQMEAEGRYLIDLSRNYPEPRYTLSYNDVGTLPRGDIAAIKAKSKNGKTYLCGILIAGMFGSSTFGLSSRIDDPVILYIDTEQNERNTALFARRVHIMAGWPVDHNMENFRAYSLRTMDIDDRLPFIEREISQHKPQAVFIDGIADLIHNFNDIDESARLILELMHISAKADCVVINVLHENKGKDDSQMKGHLGTMLLQKCSDVFQVKKTNGLGFEVKETDCRNQPIDDFTFLLDGLGIPYPGQAPGMVRLEAKEAQLRKVLTDSFHNKESLSYSELYKLIAGFEGVSQSTAKRRIREARQMELIDYDTTFSTYRLRE